MTWITRTVLIPNLPWNFTASQQLTTNYDLFLFLLEYHLNTVSRLTIFMQFYLKFQRSTISFWAYHFTRHDLPFSFSVSMFWRSTISCMSRSLFISRVAVLLVLFLHLLNSDTTGGILFSVCFNGPLHAYVQRGWIWKRFWPGRKTVSIDTHFTIPYIVIEQRQRNRSSQEAHNMLYRLI